MRISALEGARVALWGFGREGRAAWRALRERFPQQPLTAFCPPVEHAALAALADPLLSIEGEPTAERLAAFNWVIKSPGISPYSALAQQALALGAQFTSGTALWFGERLPGRKLVVTGTKGKSTTSALIAHLLRQGGRRVGLAGNIGLPLLELVNTTAPPEIWVIELSSYQTADARQPDVALVLNLFPEHLDWHGSEARYIDDKLALIGPAEPLRIVLNGRDPRLFARGYDDPRVRWFDHPDSWHLRDDWLFRGDEPIADSTILPLPGRHNRINLCAALAAIEALGIDPRPLLAHAARFRGLPHRLQSIGMRDGVEHVDDSISTTPHASLAALDCFADRRVAILVGGFDRGLDWQVFVDRVAVSPPTAIIASGQNGARIVERLRAVNLDTRCTIVLAEDLPAAVAAGQALLAGDGVLLLSPGAPSFPSYTDYAARGRAFANAAGFVAADSDALGGLGIG